MFDGKRAEHTRGQLKYAKIRSFCLCAIEMGWGWELGMGNWPFSRIHAVLVYPYFSSTAKAVLGSTANWTAVSLGANFL